MLYNPLESISLLKGTGIRVPSSEIPAYSRPLSCLDAQRSLPEDAQEDLSRIQKVLRFLAGFQRSCMPAIISFATTTSHSNATFSLNPSSSSCNPPRPACRPKVVGSSSYTPSTTVRAPRIVRHFLPSSVQPGWVLSTSCGLYVRGSH